MKIKYVRREISMGFSSHWSCKETREIKETFRTVKVGRKSLKSLIHIQKYSFIKSDFHLIKKYGFPRECEIVVKNFAGTDPENLEVRVYDHCVVLIQHLRNWVLDPRDQEKYLESLQKKENV